MQLIATIGIQPSSQQSLELLRRQGRVCSEWEIRVDWKGEWDTAKLVAVAVAVEVAVAVAVEKWKIM